MIPKDVKVKKSEVLILGITFKENFPDIRNTKVVDVCRALKSYDVAIDIYDPWAKEKEVSDIYGITLNDTLYKKKYDAVV